jgi:hypothetical protein
LAIVSSGDQRSLLESYTTCIQSDANASPATLGEPTIHATSFIEFAANLVANFDPSSLLPVLLAGFSQTDIPGCSASGNDRCSGGSLPYLGVGDRQLFPDRSPMRGLKSRFRILKFGARIADIDGRLVQSV